MYFPENIWQARPDFLPLFIPSFSPASLKSEWEMPPHHSGAGAFRYRYINFSTLYIKLISNYHAIDAKNGMVENSAFFYFQATLFPTRSMHFYIRCFYASDAMFSRTGFDLFPFSNSKNHQTSPYYDKGDKLHLIKGFTEQKDSKRKRNRRHDIFN